MGYGLGTTSGSTSATAGSGTLISEDGQSHDFSSPVRRAEVHNHPDSGVNLYLRWNGDTAYTDDWEYVLEPGDWVPSPAGLRIANVRIYSDGSATMGTNFTVFGWE